METLITCQVSIDWLCAAGAGAIFRSNGTATKDVSVVLTHGAWADGSSWARVIAALNAEVVKVYAAPLPLTSLTADGAALYRSLDRTEGPIVLAEQTQRFMAERMKAQTKAHAVDHTPSVTAPSAVVDIVRDAIRAVTAK
jgi:hypothetical protein